MQNVELSLLESGEIFPIIASYDAEVSLEALLDSQEIFSIILFSGIPVMMRVLDSQEIYTPGLVYDQEASLGTLESLELVNGYLFLGAGVSLNKIEDSSEFFSFEIEATNEVGFNLIESLEIFEPSIYTNAIFLNEIDGLEIFSSVLQKLVRLNSFESSEIIQSSIDSENQVYLNLIDSIEFFPFTVEVEDWEIELNKILSNSFVFPVSTLQTVDFPLRLKQSDGLGGEVTNNLISPAQRQYTLPANFDVDNRSHFFFSQTTSRLLNRYIPSNESLFSKEFFRALYVVNDSEVSSKTNVDFWIDGGLVYRIQNNVVSENRFFLEDEESLHDLQVPERDRYLFDGKSRTSLFGHIDVSYFVSENPVLGRFGEDGRGVGINLQNRVFTPGSSKTRLPNLAPGERVGIYLKFVVQFRPDFPIKRDYSFFHLGFTDSVTGFRETYPGPSRLGGSTETNLVLPSIYTVVETNYPILKRYLNEDVERIYEKYPPYFISLEDIGRDEQ